ncbi:growth/differentiation factor 15 [Plectropomus leopardus]|uniref:growth/differentiation factor 15 n=1 Tax=Plectropomus leopardus TaxID=160734 RepID=UPI001C4C8B95|nr:growth/differentiation factor 15 [Plectropomus leopardus]
MDKPHPLSCSTLIPNLPGRLIMLRSHTVQRLIFCTLLLLVFSSGETRPHVAQEPDVDGQREMLLEAVKTGILGSLGLEREPRPTQKATKEELREMYQLYREKVTETRGNSSHPMRETRQSTMSTVLLPATGEIFVRRGGHSHQHSGQRMQWYRAVFHKNPDIQTEVTLARAELKISRQISDKPTSVQPEVRRQIKVRVNRVKPVNSAAWTHINSANVSSTRDVMLDISPEVEKWMRTDGGEALVVDVEIVVAEKDALTAKPIISLELGLTEPSQAQKTRLRRSNKEDECDERGWCCRKSVTVSFKDIGWTDWVVAPSEYTMHFCDGTCPHNYKPASMHTQVKSRLHQITKGGSPRPCCVPAEYEPMVLMHYDSAGKLKLTPFEDLIVSKCHCA